MRFSGGAAAQKDACRVCEGAHLEDRVGQHAEHVGEREDTDWATGNVDNEEAVKVVRAEAEHRIAERQCTLHDRFRLVGL